MNAGKLNERIEIKILQNCGTSFWWEPIESVWACAEIQKGKNLFSAVGIGVVGVKFTMRRRPICLHNAIEWNGKHRRGKGNRGISGVSNRKIFKISKRNTGVTDRLYDGACYA